MLLKQYTFSQFYNFTLENDIIKMVINLLEKALELLKIFESKGYEAYLVGGFVRDYYLKKETNDIDMATNAKIKVLEKIFKKEEYTIAYNCLSFKKNGFLFQITPYRKEGKYKSRK